MFISVWTVVEGDEPCGVHSVETLLNEAPSVERPVKFVIANERALDQGVRYTETDLNRASPGDPDTLAELETSELINLYTLLSDVQRGANDLRKEVTDCLFSRLHHDQPVSEHICADDSGLLDRIFRSASCSALRLSWWRVSKGVVLALSSSGVKNVQS